MDVNGLIQDGSMVGPDQDPTKCIYINPGLTPMEGLPKHNQYKQNDNTNLENSRLQPDAPTPSLHTFIRFSYKIILI